MIFPDGSDPDGAEVVLLIVGAILFAFLMIMFIV